jgi:hypothetical protein
MQKLQTAVGSGLLNPEKIQEFAKGGKIDSKLVSRYLKTLGLGEAGNDITSQLVSMANIGYTATDQGNKGYTYSHAGPNGAAIPQTAQKWKQFPTWKSFVKEFPGLVDYFGKEHQEWKPGWYIVEGMGMTGTEGSSTNPYKGKLTALYNADGGYISGPGGPTSDHIPAMLSNGEYVVKASSVAKYGTKFMDSVNNGMYGFSIGGMALGSMMPNYSVPGAARYANGGSVSNTSVNITVNASTNSSGEDIAKAIRKEFDRISTRNQMMMTSRVVMA